MLVSDVATGDESKSNVNLSESPGCRMTLACSDELMREQVDGLAHRGGFYSNNIKHKKKKERVKM